MRISTSTIYDLNVASMNQQQTNLLSTQLHVSSGKRVMTPADDPVAAAQAVAVNQSDSLNTQYSSNRSAAKASLGLSDNILSDVTGVLQNIQTLAVNSGSGGLTIADRKMLATNLQGLQDQLFGLANTKDATGNYLFSGSQGSLIPFSKTATGATYNGDDVQRNMQVSAARQMSASDSGADIFMRIKNGNGTFATSATATNTGTGIISQGSLASPAPTALQLGNSYTITFAVAAGVTTYSITGTDSTGAALPTAGQPAALPTNVAYTSGQTILFNGMQFDIQGAPANGDTFNIAPSTNVSVFQTVTDLVNALNNAPDLNNPAGLAQFNQKLGAALSGLDQALNKTLTVRASVGSRLSEIDALQASGDALGTIYKQQLSQLTDLDYNKAISDLTQQQTSLQAAMQSFQKVSGLSLFNYM